MDVVKSIQGFVEKNSDIIKITVLIILVAVVAYLAKCKFNKEGLYMEFASSGKEVYDKPNVGDGKTIEGAKDYKSMFYGSPGETTKVSQEVDPEDLLPNTELIKELGDDSQVLAGNFLSAGLDYPVDTVGGALKKTNYSLRSIPQIPVNRDISPFMVSSWEQDIYDRPLE
ncbi:MAG: hypothetical protein RLZZ546_3133 [Bacteroidota bacterium]|jgi:hypothetical protein